MPLTLAHPAAVLPLRRYCPGRLNFPALVIGSVVPDLGYFFGSLNLEDFSHRWPGSIVFCLPVGLLLIASFFGLRRTVVRMLPGRTRRLFLPLCDRPVGNWLAIVVSLLIGIGGHLLLDSFTHKDGWLVTRSSLLQMRFGSFAGRSVRLHQVIWYIASFAGVFWLYFVYDRWRRNADQVAAADSGRAGLVEAAVVGALGVLIGLVHHVIQNSVGFYLAVALSGLLVAGIALRSALQTRS